MRVNPNAFPTELPELLERFLNAHSDSMIAVVREPMFTRVPPDSAHAFFAPFTEAPAIKTFGRDAHVRAIHAARAARLDGSAHMMVSRNGRDLHLSAVSILGTDYLVLVLHDTDGIGSLTAVPHVDGVTVFRGTCDDQLNLLSIDNSLAVKIGLEAASLEFSSLDPSLLTLELTESFLIDRVDNARRAIAELTDLGVRIAVDDFGTGYSTFEYLLSLPVFAVKIDPSFTKRLTEPRGAAMLRGLSSACRELDMMVIAEGIETFQQLNAARRAGVTHAQGYLLGMPVSTENLGMRENSAA